MAAVPALQAQPVEAALELFKSFNHQSWQCQRPRCQRPVRCVQAQVTYRRECVAYADMSRSALHTPTCLGVRCIRRHV
jgi:hypothetical protein